ncbi:MAG: type II toxin-antitoxin system Phd/YefM family antitoxin [Chloroflexi bacterium]|nr:type II toxin-antitoxin system Phd/YefM family antitoxin [Chloroflexota bacterium]
MTKTITSKEAQASYGTAIEQVKSSGEPLIIEQDGKPAVVVLPYAEFQRLAGLRESEKESLSQTRDKGFERERAAFLRLKPQLLKTHRGLYVAIHDGQVVDSDPKSLALALRMTEKKIEPVYIQLVSEEPRIVEAPSPEKVWHVNRL